MITLLVLFHSNTFRNFKYVYLFYVCQELKEEYADKGYISQSLFASLFDRVVHIITGIRSNMKNRLMEAYDKIMLRKRIIIETINDMLKNVAQIIHTATEVSQTLLSTFLQKWRLMLSTIQNLLSIWSLRWREKQRWSSSHFSKTDLRETMDLRSKTRSKESLWAITWVKRRWA